MNNSFSRTLERYRFVLIAMVIGLGLSLAAFVFSKQAVEASGRAHFQRVAEGMVESIRQRMVTYVEALGYTRALFLASDDVSREEFRTFVGSMELSVRYPGIQGIGYTVRVPKGSLKAHERAVRREGFPLYHVWPDTPREEYFSILYLEPFDWRNQRAFGFDMFTEPLRRSAMEKARDTGRAVATEPVWLVQETKRDRQQGFLIYVPVYRPGADVSTEQGRRRALLGYVYSPFRVRDLFEAVLREKDATSQTVSILVEGDARDASLREPLFESDTRGDRAPSELKSWEYSDQIEVADREWTVRVRPLSGFMSTWDRSTPSLILMTGLVLTGLLSGIVLIVQENDRRKRALLERNEHLVEELQVALQARDQFFSIASHELKTPLTSLRLQLELLLRSLPKDEASLVKRGALLEQKALLSLKQVDRLNKLIENLLDVARVRNQKLSLEREPVDLGALVSDIVQRFQEEGRRIGSAIHLECASEIVGNWDRLRLEQVVTNLLSNALKYGGGKDVFVRVAARDHATAVLSVRDQGIGISSDDQERIFERFERAVPERDFNGLGLGLFIVRQIIHAHQGEIRVRSETGEGSEFIVTLPRSAHEHQETRTG